MALLALLSTSSLIALTVASAKASRLASPPPPPPPPPPQPQQQQQQLSFGTAVKALALAAGVETTVFAYALRLPNATHGAITQQWHAGRGNLQLRVRVYVDGEAQASVDYPVALAHGVGPNQTTLGSASPWLSSLFGRTADSGFVNNFLVIFGHSVRVTLTNAEPLATWWMVRGVENAALLVAGVQLPPSARLQLQRTQATVAAGTLVTWASVEGRAGLLRQVSLVANSSDYRYQEGCVSALIDGGGDGGSELWLSSGLEDYFLGAYFHTMPLMHSAYGGFALNATSESEEVATNSVAAYRIHEHDPVLFTESLLLRWVATSNNSGHDAGWCNYAWPQASFPSAPPTPNPTLGNVTIDALAMLYLW